jgi:hypothetical protein
MLVSPFYVSRYTRHYNARAHLIQRAALHSAPYEATLCLLPCLGFDRAKALYGLTFAPSPDTRPIANGYRYYRSLLFPLDKDLGLICDLEKHQKSLKMQITLGT